MDKLNFKDVNAKTLSLKYNTRFINKFDKNMKKIQTFQDQLAGRYLKEYVSYKTGTQERSIDSANTYGKGYITINVSYAEVQAYSKRIKKKVGKRGPKPFERMKADKKESILRQVSAYSRRLNGR